jgi:hypothetical protein
MTLKEAAAIRHHPEPDGPNWWTVRKNGSWRVGCKHCSRVVRWVATDDRWEHVR